MKNIRLEKIIDIENRNNSMTLMQSLSPLQSIADVVGQIIHYRYQVKVLEVEKKRIEAEASVRHHQIDAALKAGFKLLEERRIVLQESLKLFSQDLNNSHIETRKIQDSLENLVSSLTDYNIPTEEKKIIAEAISTLSDLLKSANDNGLIKLEMIVKTTQDSLDALPRGDFLLALKGDC